MTNKTFLVLLTRFQNQKITYLKSLHLRNCLLYTGIITLKLSLRAAVVASILGVSAQWICSIMRHSMHFSSIEALSAV